MMNPAERGHRIQLLIFVAALAITFLVLGVLLIGGTIWYMDCERTSGIVNCVMTTRIPGAFVTETHTVTGVTRAIEVKDCQEDSCSYYIELATTQGTQGYFDEYSNESKASEVTQINAFLMDSGRQVFHTRVIYLRLFVSFAVFIFLGGAGLVFVLLLGISMRSAVAEWQPVLLARKGNGTPPFDRIYSATDFGRPPTPLRIDWEPSRLGFHYRHPAHKGWIFLLIAGVLFALGWGKEPIEFWIYTPIGLILFYLGLVTLINQWTIQVAEGELLVRYAPLPFYHRRRRLPLSAIIQLYVEKRTVYARTGPIDYYVLAAVLQDNRSVSLLSELPYDVLHYIELQIESWLNLEDRWVAGEASLQAPEKIHDGQEQG